MTQPCLIWSQIRMVFLWRCCSWSWCLLCTPAQIWIISVQITAERGQRVPCSMPNKAEQNGGSGIWCHQCQSDVNVGSVASMMQPSHSSVWSLLFFKLHVLLRHIEESNLVQARRQTFSWETELFSVMAYYNRSARSNVWLILSNPIPPFPSLGSATAWAIEILWVSISSLLVKIKSPDHCLSGVLIFMMWWN